MSKVSAQVTGYMTMNKSSELKQETKRNLLSAPDGKEARFQKKLYDISVLGEELQALVLEAVETLKEEKEALPPKEKAAFNTGEVTIHGRMRESGMKDGLPQKDSNGKERKHSLTSQIAFKVYGIERILVDAKAAKESSESETLEALAAALL